MLSNELRLLIRDRMEEFGFIFLIFNGKTIEVKTLKDSFNKEYVIGKYVRKNSDALIFNAAISFLEEFNLL